jgi:cell division protein FtsN
MTLQRGGTILGIFIGLVIGALLSFAVVWNMKKTELPFRDKGTRAERPANGDQSGAPLPGKPGDKVGEKPRFEFYKILPGSEEASPAAKPDDGKAVKGDAKADKGNEPQYLQLGAFQKAADADNLKARLALMGVEASVQEVDVPEKGKVFRVRTGPFRNIEELNRVRKELSQQGIQGAPVKGK